MILTLRFNTARLAAAAIAALVMATPAHAQLGSGRLAELEQRLLSADVLSIRFTATAEGAFTAALMGTMDIEGAQVDLKASGDFGDAPVTLELVTDGQVMQGTSGARRFRDAQPPALRESLLLGLTRMGVLHNLARLTSAAPPDHASGGVTEWVQARSVWADTTGEHITLRFDIHVDGSPAGSATLRLDRATGLPVDREQVVNFPGGSMTVREKYEFTARP
jgi:hypothetical protein